MKPADFHKSTQETPGLSYDAWSSSCLPPGLTGRPFSATWARKDPKHVRCFAEAWIILLSYALFAARKPSPQQTAHDVSLGPTSLLTSTPTARKQSSPRSISKLPKDWPVKLLFRMTCRSFPADSGACSRSRIRVQVPRHVCNEELKRDPLSSPIYQQR